MWRKPGGESELDFWLYADLRDPFEVVFHRVFDRHDVGFIAVDIANGAIKSRCLYRFL